MTYTATIQNGIGSAVISTQTFASIKKAKAFVRSELNTDGLLLPADSDRQAVISDDEMPSRHLRAWVRFGKINWGGDHPRSWDRA